MIRRDATDLDGHLKTVNPDRQQIIPFTANTISPYLMMPGQVKVAQQGCERLPTPCAPHNPKLILCLLPPGKWGMGHGSTLPAGIVAPTPFISFSIWTSPAVSSNR